MQRVEPVPPGSQTIDFDTISTTFRAGMISESHRISHDRSREKIGKESPPRPG